MANDDNVVPIHPTPEGNLRAACLRMARFMAMVMEGQMVPHAVVENEARLLREAYAEVVEGWVTNE